MSTNVEIRTCIARLAISVFERDAPSAAAAAGDICTNHPDATVAQALPTLLELLAALRDGTPAVENMGVGELRLWLFDAAMFDTSTDPYQPGDDHADA